MGFFILPSTLEKAKLLSDAERSAIAARLKEENFNHLSQGSSATGRFPRKSTSFQAWQALKSPHVVLLSLAKFMKGANGHSLGYFIPTIVKSFGHSPSGTQLLTIPLYIVSFCYIISLAYLADRYQARGIATCVCTLLSLIGSIIFYASAIHNVRYGSLFISLAGSYGAVPCLSAWMANNSEPYARKEVTLALGPSLSSLGGLVAVWIFAAARKPKYTLPTVISIIFSIGILLCTVLNMLWLAHAERVKVAKREEILARFTSPVEDADVEAKSLEDFRHTPTGATGPHLRATQAWDELGDKHPDFKYSF